MIVAAIFTATIASTIAPTGCGDDRAVYTPNNNVCAILLVVCSLATPGLRYIGPVCIRFTYHMQGDGVGRLLVYARFHGGLTNPVFNQTGQLGDRWVEAAVDAVLIYAESVRYLRLLHRV